MNYSITLFQRHSQKKFQGVWISGAFPFILGTFFIFPEFYNRNGFIWGAELGKLSLNTPMRYSCSVVNRQSTKKSLHHLFSNEDRQISIFLIYLCSECDEAQQVDAKNHAPENELPVTKMLQKVTVVLQKLKKTNLPTAMQ